MARRAPGFLDRPMSVNVPSNAAAPSQGAAGMRAMVLTQCGQALQMQERAIEPPGPGEVRLLVQACAVCRTDLHIVDGELPLPHLPLVPGHEIVGIVEALGSGVSALRIGYRVGVPWLGRVCGHCDYCRTQRENLCDSPLFTGHGRDGGFSTHVLADAAFCFALPPSLGLDAVHLAPLLCAGLIGWRSLRMAGESSRALGLYGFGAAAHLITQVARHQGRQVFAITREGDASTQAFAREMGAQWAGCAQEVPPAALDAAILFAPVGELVPLALRAVRKGGRVVCAGIHMSDIPRFAYALLWGERQLLSVANLTRQDAAEFLRFASTCALRVEVQRYPLQSANEALDDLRAGRLHGAAVLVP